MRRRAVSAQQLAHAAHHGDGLDGWQERADERGGGLLHGQALPPLVAVRRPPRAQPLLLQRLIRLFHRLGSARISTRMWFSPT